MKVSSHGRDDYYTVYVDGKSKMVHRYIWELYNGPIPKGMQIHHINGNKACNCICNLQLIDSSTHSRLHGNLCKLTPEQRARGHSKLKGLKRPPRSIEHRLAISKAKMGHTTSEEARAKMRASSRLRWSRDSATN